MEGGGPLPECYHIDPLPNCQQREAYHSDVGFNSTLEDLLQSTIR